MLDLFDELLQSHLVGRDLAQGMFLAGGTLVVAGLVAKEFLIKEAGVRHVVTFVTFMVVDWFCYWCLMAIYQPLIDVVQKIG